LFPVTKPHTSFTHDFVRFVGTVEVAVATPVQRDAIVVFDAREFGLRTSDVRAVELVRAVLTVVVSVAHPNFLDTLAVTARELVVSARLVCRAIKNESDEWGATRKCPYAVRGENSY